MKRLDKIAELERALQFSVDENDKKDKKINTLENRQQSDQGKGNTGSERSVRDKA